MSKFDETIVSYELGVQAPPADQKKEELLSTTDLLVNSALLLVIVGVLMAGAWLGVRTLNEAKMLRTEVHFKVDHLAQQVNILSQETLEMAVRELLHNKPTTKALVRAVADGFKDEKRELATQTIKEVFGVLQPKSAMKIAIALLNYGWQPLANTLGTTFTRWGTALLKNRDEDGNPMACRLGNILNAVGSVSSFVASNVQPSGNSTTMPEYNTWLSDLLLSIPINLEASLADTNGWVTAAQNCAVLSERFLGMPQSVSYVAPNGQTISYSLGVEIIKEINNFCSTIASA
jgi:hypothetical protein